MAAHEIGDCLHAINRAAEFVLDVADHRRHRGAVERAGWLMRQIDLRRATRLVADDAGGLVHRLVDDARHLRLALDIGFGRGHDEEGEFSADHVGRFEDRMDVGVAQGELGVGRRGEISRHAALFTSGAFAQRVDGSRMRQHDHLAAQPIVLAENFLRLQLQQLHLRRGQRRHRDTVARLEVGDGTLVRPIAQEDERQRCDAGNGEDLRRRVLGFFPCR